MDDLSFFNYLSPYCFSLIQFHCTFTISYKILKKYVYFYCILIIMFRPSGLLFSFVFRFSSFHTHASLLTFFVCFFILFHFFCSHARVFGKTRVHEFLISYSHTEWYLFFFQQCNYKCTCVFGAKN